ncbi:hypothetical protein ACKVV7_011560 [Pyricularia oryzae]
MRWDEMYAMLDKHFNTELNHAQYYTDWTATTFARMRQDNADKGAQEVLEMLLDKLRLVQRALGDEYQGERQLHTAVVRACRGVPEFEGALMVQKGTCEALFSDLRASLQVAQDRAGRQYLLQEEAHDTHFTDRRYHRNQQGPRPGRAQAPRWKPNLTPRSSTRSPGPRSSMRTHASPTTFQEKNADYCFVCKKQGCRSWKHTKEEREGARQRYHQACDTLGGEREDFDLFLTNWEANRPQPHDDTSEADNEEEDEDDQYQAAQFLQSQAFLHRATGENVYSVKPKQQADQFVLHNQYSTTYQGELWDTGAARVSTVGKCQVLAYLRENPRARIDWTPGSTEVRFGGGKAEQAIGTMTMENALGTITYHVLNAQTPFLFCLHDADKLEAYFNNVENVIVRKDGTRVPVVRKWGHPFFNVSRTEAATFFTEQELRRLHRRFGHPRTERLYKLLQEAGHRDVRQDILEKITKICHQCQTHDPAPQRFKFSIKDECEFNYEVILDVLWLDGKPVLHVIDSATGFQAATFLKDMSAHTTWNALCRIWIHIYLGPPDIITHDPGKNFASEEFHSNARIVGTTCKEMPVEAHWALGKIERAHAPLRRAFDILSQELKVFGAYPRINEESAPSATIAQRAMAMSKARKGR